MTRAPIRSAACALLLLLLVLPLLSACSVTVIDGAEQEKKPLVVCTIFPQYDIVKNIAGDTLNVELLLPYGADAHTFGVKDIPVSRLEELHGASLIIAVGGESDAQLLDELHTALPDAPTEYLLLTGLLKDLLREEQTEGMEIGKEDHDHEHEHDGGDDHDDGEEEIDEHVWTSPRRAVDLAAGVCEKLISLFPEHRALYEKNAEVYLDQLRALDEEYKKALAHKTFDTLIFADRFPFRYLCHDYGLRADAAFQGCSTEVEPSLSTLDHLCGKARALGVPAILYMEGSDPAYARRMAEEIGGQALMLHSCHVVTEEEAKKGYPALLAYDLTVLCTALGVKDDQTR